MVHEKSDATDENNQKVNWLKMSEGNDMEAKHKEDIDNEIEGVTGTDLTCSLVESSNHLAEVNSVRQQEVLDGLSEFLDEVPHHLAKIHTDGLHDVPDVQVVNLDTIHDQAEAGDITKGLVQVEFNESLSVVQNSRIQEGDSQTPSSHFLGFFRGSKTTLPPVGVNTAVRWELQSNSRPQLSQQLLGLPGI